MQIAVKNLNFESAVVARKGDGNPEGKGISGFMRDWYQTEPRNLVAKPRRQVLAELFTSMLVLSAAFKYRPAVRQPNYLYWIDGAWSLSLIAPHEWSDERRAGFVGACVLQLDMTWTVTPSALLAEDSAVSAAVGRFYDAFAETFDTDLALEEILPFHAGKLPYYPRLFAAALSRSIRTTVRLGDQASRSCRQWSELLPKRKDWLLTRANATP